MTELTVTTYTVGEGQDAVTYDVRGDLATGTADRPALLMVGSPMDAHGFGTLAGFVTDRPVVTYDPRGAGRNPTDVTPLTPEQHADDLHRVIADLAVGPVDVFASSGGAVNTLALVAATLTTYAESSPTSRRRPRCCPTRTRCWPCATTCARPTRSRAADRPWRSSSPS
jgi:pimeloyl-ACP methyl ester carboxylesterase